MDEDEQNGYSSTNDYGDSISPPSSNDGNDVPDGGNNMRNLGQGNYFVPTTDQIVHSELTDEDQEQAIRLLVCLIIWLREWFQFSTINWFSNRRATRIPQQLIVQSELEINLRRTHEPITHSLDWNHPISHVHFSMLNDNRAERTRHIRMALGQIDGLRKKLSENLGELLTSHQFETEYDHNYSPQGANHAPPSGEMIEAHLANLHIAEIIDNGNAPNLMSGRLGDRP